jgi:outer membrane receptor protein involved in Fe transport
MLFSPLFCTRRRAVARWLSALVFGVSFLWGAPFWAAAQAQPSGRATLAGTAHDAAGQPVALATFLLVAAADTARVLQGVTGDLGGHYTFEGVGPGTYRVRAQQLGYQSATSAPLTVAAGQRELTVPPLVLKATPHKLAEVTITAERPFIEQLPDKTVVNVENSLVAAGGTALDVLEKAPGVVIDQQNNRLQFKGRDGVLVLLDGKQTYLSQTEVVSLLRNTPSNSVQRIELITNPSAKYDAAGSAGIINIELKRGTRTTVAGTAGSLTLGAGYGRLPKLQLGLALNHRAGRWNTFGNYNLDYRQRWSFTDATRRFGARDSLTTLRDQNERTTEGTTHTYKLGADYTLGRRTTLGVLTTGYLDDGHARGESRNDFTNADGQLQQVVNLVNTSARTTQRLTANANLRHVLDSLGRELTADLDYAQVRIRQEDYMDTHYFDPRGQEARPGLLQRNRTPSTVGIWAAKTDYVHPLAHGRRLEAGGKISYVTSDNDVQFGTLNGAAYVPDAQRTNHFLYRETIGAAYLTGQQHWARWTLQAGLRLEYTRAVGTSLTLAQELDRSYVNFFPSAALTYKATPDHEWQASFSRRIDRPSYQTLNPFVYVLNPYSYRQGNPYLQPQYTNASQVGYTYRGETSLTLSYNHTTDVLTEVYEQRGAILVGSTANLASLHNVALSLSTPLKVNEWWTMRGTADVFWNAYRAQYLGLRLDYQRLSANFTLNNRFKLPHGLTAEVSGWYNSPTLDGQMRVQGMSQLNLGLQKSLWHNKATLRLNVSDVLDMTRSRGSLRYGATDLQYVSRWESRQARATFTYNFGNRELKATRQRRTSAEDEQSRVK